jgi:predicted transcriptional regulator
VNLLKELRNYDQIVQFCKAIASPTRAKIIRVLTEKESMNLNELAKMLNLTNGAITIHIKILKEAEIIRIENVNGVRGIQKRCFLKDRRFILDIAAHSTLTDSYETEMPIGSYVLCDIEPTCGLSTKSKIIGHLDEPRFFDDPKHFSVDILWFYSGFVEYRIPNLIRKNQVLKEIRISQEICSEAPGTRVNFPSDIHFIINNVDLGY